MGIVEKISGWKETTLGEAIYPVSDTFDLSDRKKVHFLNTGDILEGKLLHQELSDVAALPGQAKKKFRKGDILYSEIRPANKRYMMVDYDSSDSVASTKLMVLRVNENVDRKYIYQILTYSGTLKEFQSIAESRSGTFPQITFESISSFPLLLPPILEQRAIAAVLSSLDDKIELLRAQNKTLENIAQVLFKRWFVDCEFPNEKGRSYKSEGGRMINSELGEIPEGWRVGEINDYIGELESGKRPKGGVGQLKTGVPSVGAESINGISEFDFSKTKYISKEYYKAMNYGKVKEYDILVYKDGGTPGTFLPRFSMVGEGFPFAEFSINEHVFRIRPKKPFQRFYLYLWLNSYYCMRELQNIGGKAAIPGINSTDFRRISLLLPDDNIMNVFHHVVFVMFKKILSNNSQIKNLSAFRDTILPKLMRGEVRVRGPRI